MRNRRHLVVAMFTDENDEYTRLHRHRSIKVQMFVLYSLQARPHGDSHAALQSAALLSAGRFRPKQAANVNVLHSLRICKAMQGDGRQPHDAAAASSDTGAWDSAMDDNFQNLDAGLNTLKDTSSRQLSVQAASGDGFRAALHRRRRRKQPSQKNRSQQAVQAGGGIPPPPASNSKSVSEAPDGDGKGPGSYNFLGEACDLHFEHPSGMCGGACASGLCQGFGGAR